VARRATRKPDGVTHPWVTPGTVGRVLAIDLVVGLLIVVAAVVGARLGFMRALPVAGAAAGLLAASRVPLLFGQELDSDYALNIAIVAAIALGGIGAALGEAVARRVTRAARRRPLVASRAWRQPVLDGAFGAILAAAAAAVVVWALGPAIQEIRSVRDDVQRSEVLEQFNAVLAPVRPPRDKTPAAPDAPPPDDGGGPRKPPPAFGDTHLRNRPEVIRAERNLVKVVVERCGGGFQGTGWVAGPQVVVTNAHVVTASTKVTVTVRGEGRPLAATVVWFDGIHDLALLRVNALRDAEGIPLAKNPRPSAQTTSLGFPGGKLTIRGGQFGGTSTKLRLDPVKLAKTAGISLTMRERLVTYLRGLSGPGGSGSPVVNRRGEVVGTIFAGITQSDITLAVPNHVVRSALKLAQHPVQVPECNDPPLQPTPAESIAARNR
jgi:S1-C subfamily serine protease